MENSLPLYPSKISRAQLLHLEHYSERAREASHQKLLEAAQQHLEKANAAYTENRLVNIRLATAIVDVLSVLSQQWSTLPVNSLYWLRGAFQYFAKSDDDEPDFRSPIGFEDDAEILNACLRFAGRDDLCLNIEDYDDA